MIIVCPLHAVPRLVDGGDITHVMSLLGPETPHLTLGQLQPKCHLQLTFHDIAEPVDGFTAPRREHVEQMLDFVTTWQPPASLLIHCWAGISRSTAAAFAAMCALKSDEDEAEIAWTLRRMAPTASPNRLIVKHADQILGRRGRMIAAVEAIGRGAHAYEGSVFSWPVTR
ncbi:MAG TPA: protein tyrosine phosphatase [Aestuariivirgaceae bacterium]|nr:protein tyrosine phosphatase [Aestuariivirgaceae bacterium]